MAAPRTPREIADWAAAAQQDLAKRLAKHEASSHRIITLEASYAKLASLTLRQDALMAEALRCLEYGLYRPAHVAAWAACIDFCHEWAAQPARVAEIQNVRPKWAIGTAPDFRLHTDFAFFEALKAAGLVSNTFMKAMHGLLNRRNECAHPEVYDPTINDSLGYVDEVMKRIAILQAQR